MTATSGGAGEVITLPQGGGALRGTGEKFGADPQTGTGTFTVPLELPAGRRGLQPALRLAYSSGGGNGPFGPGWGVTVPGVSRKTSHGLPSYDDDRDTFLLSGAEDLVVVGTGDGVTRYRPRTEGLFARIEHHRGSRGDYWQVWTRDGQVSHYGTPRPPAAGAGWRDPAVVADPRAPGRIFAWRLTRTADTFGHHIAYEYLTDTDPAGAWTQTYLAAVRYVDSVVEGSPRYLVNVTFEHEERPDVTDDHRATFGVRTRLRCRRISVRSGTTLVRTTTLGYATAAHNAASLLSSVTVTGHDGERIEQLPPL